jgi:protein translocase SecG subunit|uniref:Probable protein-export membrane protein SecG n=1 Tax=Sundstroemia setigera TaxID=3005 RepID=A0A2U9NMR8_9STRA|nr:preprotein translocase SecG subunit [Rhizosolenia setigera]AWT38397.1 preprotein translocase SecG subunit [Rhizosolenia setigera]
MLKILWFILNIAIILLIFIRTPNNGGLASFATKSDILGSPNSAEKFLNNLTWALIMGYFSLAISFNINN